jgi:hypothetical protein
MRSAGKLLILCSVRQKRVDGLGINRNARGFDDNLQSVECVKLNLLAQVSAQGGPRDPVYYGIAKTFHLTSGRVG